MSRFATIAISVAALSASIVPACADGLSEQQIAFAAKLVQQESGGNQRDPSGRVLTSSAGARGLFQLMPGTAARLRVNPDTAEGNVRGGLTEIVRLWNKYRGDRRLIAIAYNWGEAHADAIAAGQHIELPSETLQYVRAVVSGSEPPVSADSQSSQVTEASAPTPPPPACAPSWDPWALASCSSRRRPSVTVVQSPPITNTETASR